MTPVHCKKVIDFPSPTQPFYSSKATEQWNMFKAHFLVSRFYDQSSGDKGLLQEISNGAMGQIIDFCENRHLKKTSAAHRWRTTIPASLLPNTSHLF